MSQRWISAKTPAANQTEIYVGIPDYWLCVWYKNCWYNPMYLFSFLFQYSPLFFSHVLINIEIFNINELVKVAGLNYLQNTNNCGESVPIPASKFIRLYFWKWNGSHSYMIRKDVIYFSRFSRDFAESDAWGKLKFATWETAFRNKVTLEARSIKLHFL